MPRRMQKQALCLGRDNEACHPAHHAGVGSEIHAPDHDDLATQANRG